MYQVGEYVQYGTHGICRIIGLEIQSVSKKNLEYYVLEPIEQTSSRFFIPTNNEAATSKMHPIISPDELQRILSSGDRFSEPWIDDENLRKQRYREIISSGDRAALVNQLRAVYSYKAKLTEAGRKLHLCDDNFIRDARKLLDSEFSMVLGIPQNEVGAYIQNALSTE